VKQINKTKRLTTIAVLVAIATLGSQLIWFPAGIAKAYPVQHAISVIAAITLGTGPAVTIAFLVSLLRNILGLGSLLAFPGSMVGAFLAGYLYHRLHKKSLAVIGEIIGTGIIGALFAIPFAKILMGTSFGAFFFIPPFLISSISGALIGVFIVSRLKIN